MTLSDVLKTCTDADGTVHDRPFVLVDERGGWTNVNAKAVGDRVELTADTSRPFTSDGCPELKTKQDRVRAFLLERAKDCTPYAPMILPDLVSYLECELSGDWSGWEETLTKKEDTHEE